MSRKSYIISLLFIVSTLTLNSCGSQLHVPDATPFSTNTLISTDTPEPTSTTTETPSPTATKTKTHTITPTPIHPLDKLVMHKADTEILYNWFSYVPRGLNKDETIYIWVTSATTMPTDDYENATSQIRDWLSYVTDIPDQYNYVLLTPVIPRPQTNHIYVIAYNRAVFLNNTPAMYQRPDMQLNLMVDKLTSILQQDGYYPGEKVFLDGYSAGCMFAQRYALLHPDRLMAVAGGQCGGSITLADTNYAWPVGIQDFEQLTGEQFNFSEYEELPQFYYIGSLDNNNSAVLFGNPDVYTDAQIMNLYGLFGREDPERLENQVQHLNSLGYTNVQFKLYPAIQHVITPQMIKDTFNFFENYR